MSTVSITWITPLLACTSVATTLDWLTITPAPVTISTGNVVRQYNGTTSATGTPVPTVGTIFGGDTPSGGTFTFDNKNVGTGKTVTLQKLAESFSQIGVPVFMADVKGDLSGISQAGKRVNCGVTRNIQRRLDGASHGVRRQIRGRR